MTTPSNQLGLKDLGQALTHIAPLDPQSLMYAMKLNPEATVRAWHRHMPQDATVNEIVTAADQIHRDHPSWQIRAGDVRDQILRARREQRARHDRQIRADVALQRKDQPRLKPDDLPEEIKQQLAKHVQ